MTAAARISLAISSPCRSNAVFAARARVFAAASAVAPGSLKGATVASAVPGSASAALRDASRCSLIAAAVVRSAAAASLIAAPISARAAVNAD
ncbi:hypothetical protein AB3K78_00180 [Leucobacter sp. HNU]|uniref:hypothetical protein n=1 Tax=Leucobacter sp. HNU TaxID=3236805 RepID=UPI003A8109D9